ncbi:MAG: molybdopterin-dependent oxidoreductase [Coriobacteriales bacterium]|jgi:anaerobic selenocysteine-containing dehydrogenase|nr:molybdopterin-dependent oxidoreductase [Coriobacteriales bacterium]
MKVKATKAIKLDTLSEVNDLGKPWRYEDEGCTVTRSSVWSPPGCHPVGCGLKLYVDDKGKLVRVEGDENHPVTQGRLCPRCIALKDYVYNPSRIVYPMRRDPQFRGQDDKWERISWDEALDLIEERYKALTGQYGRETMVIFTGTGREGGTMAPFATMAFATPNFCYTQSGYACYTPRLAACAYITGIPYPELDYAAGLPGRYDDPEYEVPEVIMLWGKEPLPSNPDGFFGHAVIDLMRRGARLISVDPRVNWLSTRADFHLRLRPGTDTALALGLLNVIITEELYDKDFVDYWTYGFEALAERASEMTPEKVSGITGVPVEDILGAARMYATAKPASILWGLAVDQKTNGMQNGQAVVALMAITGNIDRPGGQVVGDINSGLNEGGFGFDAGIGPELAQKMIGIAEYPGYCNLILNSQADLTLKAMETDDPYPLRMGMYTGNNLLACTSAEPRRWRAAINRSLEFCIAFDCFMTPSAQATCDLFLPLATVVEREGALFAEYGAAPLYFGAMNKAIEPGECRSDLELCFMLGKRLNPHLWEEYDTVRDFINHLRLGRQYDFEDLRKEVTLQQDVSYFKYENGSLRRDGQLGFNTPSGRIELYSSAFMQFNDDPLPYYEEPHFSPVSTPDLFKEYPFVLTTGARTYAFFHSEHRQVSYLRELNPDPLVEVNPKVAAHLGIADGQWCEVFNHIGSAKYKAKVTETVNEGTLHAQHGWWFPEADPNDADENGPYQTFRSNINNLVPNFHMGKIGFGAPFKSMIANIRPIEASYDTDMADFWDRFGKLV